jgi:hypothetical protein
MHTNDAPQTPGVHLALFADDISLYATYARRVLLLEKFQRGLSPMETWCERWNIKINKDKSKEIYFLTVVDRLSPILHLMDEIFHL